MPSRGLRRGAERVGRDHRSFVEDRCSNRQGRCITLRRVRDERMAVLGRSVSFNHKGMRRIEGGLRRTGKMRL